MLVTRSIDSPKQGEWWNRSKGHLGVQLGAKGDEARDRTRQNTHYLQHRFMVHPGNKAGDRRGDRHTCHTTQARTEGPGLSLRAVPGPLGKKCTGGGPRWSFSGHCCPQDWCSAGFCNPWVQGRVVHVWRNRQMTCQRCGIKGGLYSYILLSPREYTQNYRSLKVFFPMGIYTKLQIFESSFATNYVNIFLSNGGMGWGGGNTFFPLQLHWSALL